MSYLLYINGEQIDLKDSGDIALNKQVNTIGKLDSRQANFSKQFKVRKTQDNVRKLNYLGIVGNQSDVPYQKNDCQLIDVESGISIIKKGWAIVKDSDESFYNIHIYDGSINFFKAIENLTLTDLGITDLDHVKNITKVIESFDNTKPYKYIIADYNGKSPFIDGFDANIDYLVPSARISYLWERIFAYTGFNYTGSVFNTEKFLNLFMTYPKPVPTLVPLLNNVTSQQAVFSDRWVQQPSGEYIIFVDVNFFPNIFSNAYASTTSSITPKFNISGSYRIKATGSFTVGPPAGPYSTVDGLSWTVVNASNTIIATGTINGTSAGATEIININANERLYFSVPGFNFLRGGDMFTEIDYIVGYDASFSESLVNFKVTDFVNEILGHFALTPFFDADTNTVDFLKLSEILNTSEAEDWSDKNPSFQKESYAYSNYAKRNNFKYKYNDKEDTNGDWYIDIDNENLKEEITVFNSKFYCPEIGDTNYFNQREIYKIWEKEVRDNSSIKYKELKDRYHLIRSTDTNFASGFRLGSSVLNQSQNYTGTVPMGNFSRLRFKEVLEDNYSPISNILNRSKLYTSRIYLNSLEYSRFTLKKLVYISQKGSYFLVNKISNFIKNKYATVELIEVKKGQTSVVPPPPIIYTIEPVQGTVIVNACILKVDITTNIPLSNSDVNYSVIFEPIAIVFPPPSVSVQGTRVGNTIEVNLSNVPAGIYGIRIQAFTSLFVSPYINVASTSTVPYSDLVGSCYNPQVINVTSATQSGTNVTVNFTTNIPFPFGISLSGGRLFPTFAIFLPVSSTANSGTVVFSGVPAGPWECTVQSSTGITSNTFYI
ncbi:MAG: hypothetical protein ACRCU6_05990 [Fusobacteriaceae bacterium]